MAELRAVADANFDGVYDLLELLKACSSSSGGVVVGSTLVRRRETFGSKACARPSRPHASGRRAAAGAARATRVAIQDRRAA
eukprot:1543254-Prymnesium_polylepis.1